MSVESTGRALMFELSAVSLLLPRSLLSERLFLSQCLRFVEGLQQMQLRGVYVILYMFSERDSSGAWEHAL